MWLHYYNWFSYQRQIILIETRINQSIDKNSQFNWIWNRCKHSGDVYPGADPEKFSRGGATLTYNCGSAQIWKIANFFISSNIGDIKLCKSQGGGGQDPPPPLDPRMVTLQIMKSFWQQVIYILKKTLLRYLHLLSIQHASWSPFVVVWVRVGFLVGPFDITIEITFAFLLIIHALSKYFRQQVIHKKPYWVVNCIFFSLTCFMKSFWVHWVPFRPFG